MSNQIKVSVVIPVYKVEKYIERCVRSLFEQTLDSLEYIFVDDCSPDQSIEIMQKVLEEYPHRKDQVKIIRHEVNQGVGAARNHGVAACTGDYIIHCDPDDWVDLDMYEAMYNKAVETNADVIRCSFIMEFFNRKITHDAVPYPSIEEYINDFRNNDLNNLWSKLYKREIASDSTLYTPDDISMGEDLLRNVQMLSKCKTLEFVPDIYYHYYQNINSMVNNYRPEFFRNITEIADFLEKNYSDKIFLAKNLRKCLLMRAIFNYRKNGKQTCCYEYWKSVKLSDKLKIISASETNLKEKIVLIISCINFRYATRLFFLLKNTH